MKDRLGAHILLELHQEAGVTNEHVEREVRLHVVELSCLEEALAKRRHPQIHKRTIQRRAAKPAIAVRPGDVMSLERCWLDVHVSPPVKSYPHHRAACHAGIRYLRRQIRCRQLSQTTLAVM